MCCPLAPTISLKRNSGPTWTRHSSRTGWSMATAMGRMHRVVGVLGVGVGREVGMR